MKLVKGISGIGEGSQVSSSTAAVGWGIILGVTVLVVAGTLLLKPAK